MRRPVRLGLMLMLGCLTPASAQQFVLRLDSRLQAAEYRGLRRDSVLATGVVTGPNGGFETPDGYAASCLPNATWCQFYRPGPTVESAPLMTSADLTAWGLGLNGLSVHLNGRLGVDLGTADTWPGTNPAVQLIEGYAEYAQERIVGRLGRQVERGRLGYNGYDGGRFSYRLPGAGLTGAAYLGLGLARATALPVTSDALNPLDEFQPRRRQILAGGAVEWQAAIAEARLEYAREVDRDTRNFVSERAAISANFRPLTGWSLSGGAEYDLSHAWWGSADLTLRHSRDFAAASVGVRRYRPYFDLWTLWGVFSPVPYSAVNGSLWIGPLKGLTLRAGGERYWYADAEAESPLVNEEDNGWRWNAGVGYAPSSVISLDAGYQAEFGPGAASQGVDGSVSVRPVAALTLTAEAGHLVRPLEFRINNPALTWYGLSLDLRATERLRLGIAATRYDENRRRPDASGIDWSQTRVRASLSWLFGSNADRMPLPPAIRREGRR